MIYGAIIIKKSATGLVMTKIRCSSQKGNRIVVLV